MGAPKRSGLAPVGAEVAVALHALDGSPPVGGYGCDRRDGDGDDREPADAGIPPAIRLQDSSGGKEGEGGGSGEAEGHGEAEGDGSDYFEQGNVSVNAIARVKYASPLHSLGLSLARFTNRAASCRSVDAELMHHKGR